MRFAERWTAHCEIRGCVQASAASARQSQFEGESMKHFLIGVTAMAAIAVTGAVSAQVPPPAAAPPAASYSAQPYPFPSVSPEDAYRDGLINRWELEQYTGPTPQALQGPSVNGNKGLQTGGDGGGM
jgi:hypothetical protein